MSAKFNDASSLLLIQSMAYMMDIAFEGNKESVFKVAEQVPSVCKTYFEIKEGQEKTTNYADMEEEELRDLIATMLHNDEPDKYGELSKAFAALAGKGAVHDGKGN